MSQIDDLDSIKAPKNHVAHFENQGDTQHDAWKDARKAAQAEKDMTLWQALQGSWKAALWSAVISLTIIMEGYDVGESGHR